jgi:hypothetical protein
MTVLQEILDLYTAWQDHRPGVVIHRVVATFLRPGLASAADATAPTDGRRVFVCRNAAGKLLTIALRKDPGGKVTLTRGPVCRETSPDDSY